MPKRRIDKKKKSPISIYTKLLLLSGVLIVAIPIFFYANETIQLAFFTPKVPIIAKKYSALKEIIIHDIHIDLPIKEEAIRNNAWGIADDGASHLNTSARPGESGPIILYGHNTSDRFGPIRWLTSGQNIIIKTSKGKAFSYIITKTEDVYSSEINLFNVNKETLILYTCDGFADLQRFVVFANRG